MTPASQHLGPLVCIAGIGVLLVGLLLLLDGGSSAPPGLAPVAAPATTAAAPVEALRSSPPPARDLQAMTTTDGVLTGVVRSCTALAVAGAVVCFDDGTRHHEVETDARGEFAVAGIVAGRYRVVVMGPQLPTHTEFVDVAAPPAALVLTVDQGAVLRGQVVDHLQRPLPGARVTPWRRDSNGEGLDARCAVTTDWRGGFELHGDAANGTFVLVESPGCTPTKARLQPERVGVVQMQRAQK